jgi:hypothetical protein
MADEKSKIMRLAFVVWGFIYHKIEFIMSLHKLGSRIIEIGAVLM